MSARDDMQRVVIKVRTRSRALLDGCALAAHTEYKVGGPITGAPGQPVDKGALRNSIQLEKISDDAWQSSTTLPYATAIEDGVGPHGPLTLRSSVGGFHSRKLVVTGFQNIVTHVRSELGVHD